eukprot:TRINITY_DN38275_c0_g1_i1.p1 TRINITY_DN38275_c0_g1~~TRINITY_DN38275_c0_g1_i1.p1  ORF type:complete len:2845 (-),score=635.89 TRINITY_DN38275_c0_g1_i1:518-8047(-)
MPPRPCLKVTKLAPGSWGECQDIQVGDHITEVNGIRVSKLSADGFKQAMKARPISLKLAPKAIFRKTSTGHFVVRTSLQQQREAKIGSQPEKPAADTADSHRASTLQHVESKAAVAAAMQLEAKEILQVREVVAGPDVTGGLGLGCCGMPPKAMLRVTKLAAGSWGEAQNIEVGDHILAVNGTRVSKLSTDLFKKAMQNRPISLNIAPKAAFRKTNSGHFALRTLLQKAGAGLEAMSAPASFGRAQGRSPRSSDSQQPAAQSRASRDLAAAQIPMLEKSPSAAAALGPPSERSEAVPVGDETRQVEPKHTALATAIVPTTEAVAETPLTDHALASEGEHAHGERAPRSEMSAVDEPAVVPALPAEEDAEKPLTEPAQQSEESEEFMHRAPASDLVPTAEVVAQKALTESALTTEDVRVPHFEKAPDDETAAVAAQQAQDDAEKRSAEPVPVAEREPAVVGAAQQSETLQDAGSPNAVPGVRGGGGEQLSPLAVAFAGEPAGVVEAQQSDETAHTSPGQEDPLASLVLRDENEEVAEAAPQHCEEESPIAPTPEKLPRADSIEEKPSAQPALEAVGTPAARPPSTDTEEGSVSKKEGLLAAAADDDHEVAGDQSLVRADADEHQPTASEARPGATVVPGLTRQDDVEEGDGREEPSEDLSGHRELHDPETTVNTTRSETPDLARTGEHVSASTSTFLPASHEEVLKANKLPENGQSDRSNQVAEDAMDVTQDPAVTAQTRVPSQSATDEAATLIHKGANDIEQSQEAPAPDMDVADATASNAASRPGSLSEAAAEKTAPTDVAEVAPNFSSMERMEGVNADAEALLQSALPNNLGASQGDQHQETPAVGTSTPAPASTEKDDDVELVGTWTPALAASSGLVAVEDGSAGQPAAPEHGGAERGRSETLPDAHDADSSNMQVAAAEEGFQVLEEVQESQVDSSAGHPGQEATEDQQTTEADVGERQAALEYDNDDVAPKISDRPDEALPEAPRRSSEASSASSNTPKRDHGETQGPTIEGSNTPRRDHSDHSESQPTITERLPGRRHSRAESSDEFPTEAARQVARGNSQRTDAPAGETTDPEETTAGPSAQASVHSPADDQATAVENQPSQNHSGVGLSEATSTPEEDQIKDLTQTTDDTPAEGREAFVDNADQKGLADSSPGEDDNIQAIPEDVAAADSTSGLLQSAAPEASDRKESVAVSGNAAEVPETVPEKSTPSLVSSADSAEAAVVAASNPGELQTQPPQDVTHTLESNAAGLASRLADASPRTSEQVELHHAEEKPQAVFEDGGSSARDEDSQQAAEDGVHEPWPPDEIRPQAPDDQTERLGSSSSPQLQESHRTAPEEVPKPRERGHLSGVQVVEQGEARVAEALPARGQEDPEALANAVADLLDPTLGPTPRERAASGWGAKQLEVGEVGGDRLDPTFDGLASRTPASREAERPDAERSPERTGREGVSAFDWTVWNNEKQDRAWWTWGSWGGWHGWDDSGTRWDVHSRGLSEEPWADTAGAGQKEKDGRRFSELRRKLSAVERDRDKQLLEKHMEEQKSQLRMFEEQRQQQRFQQEMLERHFEEQTLQLRLLGEQRQQQKEFVAVKSEMLAMRDALQLREPRRAKVAAEVEAMSQQMSALEEATQESQERLKVSPLAVGKMVEEMTEMRRALEERGSKQEVETLKWEVDMLRQALKTGERKLSSTDPISAEKSERKRSEASDVPAAENEDEEETVDSQTGQPVAAAGSLKRGLPQAKAQTATKAKAGAKQQAASKAKAASSATGKAVAKDQSKVEAAQSSETPTTRKASATKVRTSVGNLTSKAKAPPASQPQPNRNCACGEPGLGGDVAFCRKCGRKAGESEKEYEARLQFKGQGVVSEQIAEPRHCGQCQKRLPDDAAYCIKCGTKWEPEDPALGGKGRGCDIKNMEERCVTVEDIHLLSLLVQKRQRQERWKESPSFYALVNRVLQPATQKRRCSYSELISLTAARPKWFASHWWGQPVADFEQAITGHCTDRGLGMYAPYWVLVFAVSYWKEASKPGSEFGSGPPWDSPASRAQRFAEAGTVLVAEITGQCFRRVWCCFEMWSCLPQCLAEEPLDGGTAKHRAVPVLDVYVVNFGHMAAGVTVDFCNGGVRQLLMQRPLGAPANFPLCWVRRCAKMHVEEGEAASADDRDRVLNCMLGAKMGYHTASTVHRQAWPEHPRYDFVSEAIRSAVVTAAWRNLMESSETAGIFQQSLKASQLRKLELPFSCGEARGSQEPVILTSSLPHELEDLSLYFCNAAALARCELSSLSTLGAGLFEFCRKHTSRFGEIQMVKLHRLKIHFPSLGGKSTFFGDTGPWAWALASAIPPGLLDLTLQCPGAEFDDKLMEALSGSLPSSLVRLSMDVSGCRMSNRGLGIFGAGLHDKTNLGRMDMVVSIKPGVLTLNGLEGMLSYLGGATVKMWRLDTEELQQSVDPICMRATMEKAVQTKPQAQWVLWRREDLIDFLINQEFQEMRAALQAQLDEAQRLLVVASYDEGV